MKISSHGAFPTAPAFPTILSAYLLASRSFSALPDPILVPSSSCPLLEHSFLLCLDVFFSSFSLSFSVLWRAFLRDPDHITCSRQGLSQYLSFPVWQYLSPFLDVPVFICLSSSQGCELFKDTHRVVFPAYSRVQHGLLANVLGKIYEWIDVCLKHTFFFFCIISSITGLRAKGRERITRH